MLKAMLYLNTSHLQYSLCTVLLTEQFMYSAADSTVYVQCCWQYSLCKMLLTVQFMYSAADSTVYVQCCWQYSLCTMLLTLQFMYSAADSTAGCSEGEICNGTASSHWPYTYKSHTIQGNELLMTCLELSADSVLCCFVITYSSAEWNRKLWANCQYMVWSVDIAVAG